MTFVCFWTIVSSCFCKVSPMSIFLILIHSCQVHYGDEKVLGTEMPLLKRKKPYTSHIQWWCLLKHIVITLLCIEMILETFDVYWYLFVFNMCLSVSQTLHTFLTRCFRKWSENLNLQISAFVKSRYGFQNAHGNWWISALFYISEQ